MIRLFVGVELPEDLRERRIMLTGTKTMVSL